MIVSIRLPVPPSVNRTRRVDWRARKPLDAWTRTADAMVVEQRVRTNSPISRFELNIVVSEGHTRCDLDNILKHLVDFLRRINVIEDDSPRHLRKLTMRWGKAPEGCRVTVIPWVEEINGRTGE
jgi:Holliday junction resolvase RusA-like endonuclease